MLMKRWGEFFLYLVRVFVLLILLAVLLPKLIVICNQWISSFFHYDQKPNGNPMRVESPVQGECVMDINRNLQSDDFLKLNNEG